MGLGSQAVECSVSMCAKPVIARGYCWRHYTQIRKYGEIQPERGPINYKAAHMRVRKERGPARAHLCVDCHGPATQWSYDRDSQCELTGDSNGYAVVFSPDPSDYSPRCRACHIEFDRRNPTV